MPTPFAVMTWNVENLFPPGHRIGPHTVVSEAAYQAKLTYLAERTLEVAPDVLAVQEVGGQAPNDTRTLDDFQDHLQGQYPFKALSAHPDGRGIRVGFLARLPILQRDDLLLFAPGELVSVPDWFPNPPVARLGRGALRIDVEPTPGVRIRLLAVHLKSKLVTYPSPGEENRFSPTDENERSRGEGLALLRRTAEAVAVRVYLNALMKADAGAHTLVLGDFNDEPRAATSQIIAGPEDADVTSDDKIDPMRLYNLVDSIPRRGDESNDKRFLPEQERFSRMYQGRRQLIDHILASKGLLGQIQEIRQDRWQVQEVRILVDSIQGQSVADNPLARVDKPRPDHAPVYARFVL